LEKTDLYVAILQLWILLLHSSKVSTARQVYPQRPLYFSNIVTYGLVLFVTSTVCTDTIRKACKKERKKLSTQ